MKIKRRVEGMVIEITMTDRELIDAYTEQRAKYDFSDVSYHIQSDYDGVDDRIYRVISGTPFIREVASEARRKADNFGSDFYANVESIVSEHVDELAEQYGIEDIWSSEEDEDED